MTASAELIDIHLGSTPVAPATVADIGRLAEAAKPLVVLMSEIYGIKYSIHLDFADRNVLITPCNDFWEEQDRLHEEEESGRATAGL